MTISYLMNKTIFVPETFSRIMIGRFNLVLHADLYVCDLLTMYFAMFSP